MIADKAENNPVFRSQVSKRKGMLCAAFAVAACSAGLMFGLAKDSPEALTIAGMMTAWGLYLTSPTKEKKFRKNHNREMKDNAIPYGQDHPYQILTDSILPQTPEGQRVVVYKSDHESMVYSAAFTDRHNIYVGQQFEEGMGDTEHIKAVIAHEVGHMQDGRTHEMISNISSSLTITAMMTMPIIVMCSPLSISVLMTSAAATLLAHRFNVAAGLYISRRSEHMADIRAMYNTNSKDIVQLAIGRCLGVSKQNALEFFDKKNAERRASGKPEVDPPKLLEEDYDSSLATHPNPGERRQVMDEAAKYMP